MSHLNLPERIHEKPIEDNYWPDYSLNQAEIEKMSAELNPKFIGKNHYMGKAKELSDIAIIQNPQGNVYYHKKSYVEEIQILKEKVALTMYGLI
jgi:hypothetical protein